MLNVRPLTASLIAGCLSESLCSRMPLGFVADADLALPPGEMRQLLHNRDLLEAKLIGLENLRVALMLEFAALRPHLQALHQPPLTESQLVECAYPVLKELLVEVMTIPRYVSFCGR